jgi:peroxiredoxin
VTVAAKGVPGQAIDSRARTEGEVPDPELHQTAIAQAITQRPPLRRGDLHEPWVFVIGPDGRIAARFDNVASRTELEAAPERLPTT